MAGIVRNQSYAVSDKAASWTVTRDDIGKLFVVTAAATATLPAIADVWDGWNVKFYSAADAAMTITAPSGKLVTFNNAAATSIAGSTSAEKAGWGVEIIYDATLAKYIAWLGTEETQTISVS